MLLPLRRRLQKHVATWPWRRVGVLAGISLVLALMLVGYLFGASDHFFSLSVEESLLHDGVVPRIIVKQIIPRTQEPDNSDLS